MALLKIRAATNALGPVGTWEIPFIKAKVSDIAQAWNLFLVPWLSRRPYAQDAWVARNAQQWLDRGFEHDPTVVRSRGFVPLPCRRDDPEAGELLKEPDSGLITRLWDRRQPWVEIVGVGGAGKTMRGVQICRWASEALGEDGRRFRRLPLFIDEETAGMRGLVRRKVKAVLDEEVAEDFLRALLRSVRLLLVFDRLSERSHTAIDRVVKLQGTISVGAALVTTRRTLEYEGHGVVRLCPVSLGPESAMFFMSALLARQDESFSSMWQQIALAQKLASMDHGSRHRAAADATRRQALRGSGRGACQENSGPGVASALASGSLRRIAQAREPGRSHGRPYLSHEDMLRAARVLAVLAVEEACVPQAIAKDDARRRLRSEGWNDPERCDPIERLVLNGVLIERSRGARFDLEFALDPVAEYLAADELLHQCFGNAAKKSELFERVRGHGESAAGLLTAREVSRDVRRRSADSK